MNATATAWLAYELSRNAFILGLVVFLGQIFLLFSPLAGVWGDRLDRRRLIIALQGLSLLLSLTLAAVTHLQLVSVAWLLVFSGVRGVLNAVEFPARQAFVIELVTDKRHLGNAIALGSSLFNAARLIGPPVAGLVIVLGGPALCFLLDAISYGPVLAGLLLMRMTRRPAREKGAHAWDELRAGLRYALRSAGLRAPLLMVPVIALVGFCSSTLAPLFARDIFLGDARTLGQLMAAVGAGALVSALYLSVRTTTVGLTHWITRGAVLAGLGQAIFALSPWLVLALGAMVLSGMGAVLVMAGCNTLIQSHVEDDKRGRVMGLFTMGQGMYPVGSLLSGMLASAAGAREAVLVSAGVCLVAAFVFGRQAGTPPAPTTPTVVLEEAPG